MPRHETHSRTFLHTMTVILASRDSIEQWGGFISQMQTVHHWILKKQKLLDTTLTTLRLIDVQEMNRCYENLLGGSGIMKPIWNIREGD